MGRLPGPQSAPTDAQEVTGPDNPRKIAADILRAAGQPYGAADIEAAVALFEPERDHERPFSKCVGEDLRKYWVYPYAGRIRYLLARYLAADGDLQTLVRRAAADRIYWRGDDYEMFQKVATETLKAREMEGQGQRYPKHAIVEMKQLMAVLGAHRRLLRGE